ncbi:hypothetical protein, partial [Rhodoplanes serenus]|uniref:hypothetical protein n=1 Tax=Rhodoplanes serenus TaxID=200615 RepID=UPI0011B94B7F
MTRTSDDQFGKPKLGGGKIKVGKPQNEREQRLDSISVKHTIGRFLKDFNALEFAFPLAIGALETSFDAAAKGFAQALAAAADPSEFEKFKRGLNAMIESTNDNSALVAGAQANRKKKKAHEASVNIQINAYSEQLQRSIDSLSSVTSARDLISRSFVVTLVSQFDAYLSNLVRALYKVRPDILGLHSKTVSYSEIVELGDSASIEERLVENEIESLLRSSHSDQFKWLEGKFDVPLRVSDERWAAFVELTERRNLFVHANARISSQYLRVCKNNKVPLPSGCKTGQKLEATEDYFRSAYSILVEIGVKLGIVLWRKVSPKDQDEADSFLIITSYDLIKKEKYEVARSILETFLFSVPTKGRSESYHRKMIINLAQCHKWLGNSKECETLLNKFDWSATSLVYNLAVATLRGDFTLSNNLARTAVLAGEMSRNDLEDWPLFREFRDAPQYYELKIELDQVTGNGDLASRSRHT